MSLFVWIFILFGLGLFCILTRKNLIKTLIGVELIGKSATLAIIYSGVLKNMLATAQAMAIMVIVVEVIIVAVFLALIYSYHEKSDTLDTTELKKLKG